MVTPYLLAASLILAGSLSASAQNPDDPEGKALIQQARQTVAAYHAGQPPSKSVLRVVYFVANNREPLPEYTARLDRVVKDVSEYYRDGLRRFGIETNGLPLESKDGHVLIHLVRGQKPAGYYHYDSGSETRNEIGAALKDSIDLNRECVLAFYGLCEKQLDGRYIFDAPYYGGGSQASGFCHAADCELLDPKLLTDSKRSMVFTEHAYPRLEKNFAAFNSMYLGGVAHELGHGLGLPHDAASADEPSKGDSLMGFGNLSYRRDNRNGVFLKLRGRFYDKGLYAHSPAHYVFPVGGKWKTFTATIGLRDGAADQGSAVFIVRGDGKELYRSPILRAGSREEASASLASVQSLELRTEPGEDHNHNSWAIWVEPMVTR